MGLAGNDFPIDHAVSQSAPKGQVGTARKLAIESQISPQPGEAQASFPPSTETRVPNPG